jgi:rare lipoprotein A
MTYEAVVCALAVAIGCAVSSPAHAAAPRPAERATSRPARAVVGVASWYGPRHQGHPTASGEPFDMRALTAAHRTLPLGTRVRVTSLENGRSVVVRLTDRGPYVPGRLIDLSYAAGRALGMVGQGLARVRVEPVPTVPDDEPGRVRLTPTPYNPYTRPAAVPAGLFQPLPGHSDR